jgi:hypothetical protein
MCCWTHAERDTQDKLAGVPFTLAENDLVRCQCRYGMPCMRRATQEDGYCDWCRGRNHDLACENGAMPSPKRLAAARAFARLRDREGAVTVILPAGPPGRQP